MTTITYKPKGKSQFSELNIKNLLDTGKAVTLRRYNHTVQVLINGRNVERIPVKKFQTVEKLMAIADVQLDEEGMLNLLLAIEGTVAKHSEYSKHFGFNGRSVVIWIDVPPLGRLHHIEGMFLTRDGSTSLENVRLHLRDDLGVKMLGKIGMDMYDILIDDMMSLSEDSQLTPQMVKEILERKGYSNAPLYIKMQE